MQRPKSRPRQPATEAKNLVTALVADAEGTIFELEGYAAVGMAGKHLVPLSLVNTIRMPHGGELMYLPDRVPMLFNLARKMVESVHENPYRPGTPIFPVAAFNSPGFVLRYVCAYEEKSSASVLPLFSYGAVGWKNGVFRSAAICVDREKRQDLRYMPQDKIMTGVRQIQKKMPTNRLRAHLENCALRYGCPAAKNFFLGRYEAPLPTSRSCNARCLGCISLQKGTQIPICQERIAFTPDPDEIAQIALEHIQRVKQSVVSFGQGCEGDPLLAAEVIEPAIAGIRAVTTKGTINMNTNAGRPEILARLFDTGLDSIRVSMNSVRARCYETYFRPQGYRFADVTASIETALERRKLVFINYLNTPGFTDSPEEFDTLCRFLEKYPIHLIQWRNLNFDPVHYWKAMIDAAAQGPPLGMQTIMDRVRKLFPSVKFGYFNPPKERFHLA